MLSQDIADSSGNSTALDGETYVPSARQPPGPVSVVAMKCADSLPNLSGISSHNMGSTSVDIVGETQAKSSSSPKGTSSTDMHQSSEYFSTNASLSAHGSPRYNPGTFYRGNGGNAYNGNGEFGSKRAHHNMGHQGGGGVGRGNFGSFSPQNVSGTSGFGYSNHGGRSGRDIATGDGRMVGRRMGRSATTDDMHGGPNHGIRILQRPMPLQGRHAGENIGPSEEHEKSSPEALQHQQQLLKRGGHRKKTLSLNPEEREALENLVEEVLIGGLEEAIIDSDGTSSDEHDDDAGDNIDSQGTSESNRGNRPDNMRRGDAGKSKKFGHDSRIVVSKASTKDNAAGSERNFSPKSDGKFANKNNVREFNRRGRDSASAGSKDSKKSGEFNRGGSKVASPEEDKEKPNAATVRGVNIYPAQLKVAIKHMDSLPPRFLRRLQTGSSRTSGNETILARLTMKSPTTTNVIAEDAGSVQSSPTDRDRGRSKQTQLQTKKTIRNLLSDLDQYTDETVTKDDCSLRSAIAEGVESGDLVYSTTQDTAYMNAVNTSPSGQIVRPQLPFHTVPPPALELEQQFTSPVPSMQGMRSSVNTPMFGQSNQLYAGQRMPPSAPRVISCEELERELLQGGNKAQENMSMISGVNPNMNKLNSQQLSVPNQFYSHPPPVQPESGYLGYDIHQHPPVMIPGMQATSPVAPKKTQFSVDAPEFVSNLFPVNRHMTRSEIVAASSEPFYSGPQSVAGSSEISVQLTDNVHLPTKPTMCQYPLVVASSAGMAQSSSGTTAAADYADMAANNESSVPHASPYQMIPYNQMNSTGMDMMRNAPPYMVPMSLSMPPPAASGSNELSPSVVDMNVMAYQQYQYVPENTGYGSGSYPPPAMSDFQSPVPSEFSHPPPSFMAAAPICPSQESLSSHWMGDPSVQPQQSQVGWYSGYQDMPYEGANTYSQTPPTGFDSGALYGSSPVAAGYPPPAQLMNACLSSGDSWPPVGLTPFEYGYQKVLQLLHKGVNVMVILIGGPEGNKSRLISANLPPNGTGPVILNIRNGANSVNAGKMYEIHDWNMKQVINALETRRSPIIIDHTYAQSWEMERYTKLGEMHGYHVEVIDSTGSISVMREANDNVPKVQSAGGDMYRGPSVINPDMFTGQSMQDSDVYQLPKDVNNIEAMMPNM